LKTLTPSEYNTYRKKPGEVLDFSDFEEPEHIINSEKYKTWPILANIYKAVTEGRSNSDIYILTARHARVKQAILQFLQSNGITMDPENVITIGDAAGDIIIADVKKSVLKKLAKKYDKVYFFDDDPKNIALASEIDKVKTRLIETDI
jgi:hypothetical protein